MLKWHKKSNNHTRCSGLNWSNHHFIGLDYYWIESARFGASNCPAFCGIKCTGPSPGWRWWRSRWWRVLFWFYISLCRSRGCILLESNGCILILWGPAGSASEGTIKISFYSSSISTYEFVWEPRAALLSDPHKVRIIFGFVLSYENFSTASDTPATPTSSRKPKSQPFPMDFERKQFGKSIRSIGTKFACPSAQWKSNL